MTDEADNLAAREWAQDFLRFQLSKFSLDASRMGRSFSLFVMALRSKGGQLYPEDSVKRLVDQATRGDAEAHHAVCMIIRAYLKKKDPLPAYLNEFLFEMLDGKRVAPKSKRGWSRTSHYGRDWSIQLAVTELTHFYGLNRTRNAATNKPCACSIVAEALRALGTPVSEKTVAEITKEENIDWLIATYVSERYG